MTVRGVPRRWLTGTAISVVLGVAVSADSVVASRSAAPLPAVADSTLWRGSGGAFVGENGTAIEPASAAATDGVGERRLRGWTDRDDERRSGRPCTPRRQAIEALGESESGGDVVEALQEALVAPDAFVPGLSGPVGGPDGSYAFAGFGAGESVAAFPPAFPGAPGGAFDGPTGPPGGDLVLPAPVPEPGVWTLLILGFGILGAGVRRRGRVARRNLPAAS